MHATHAVVHSRYRVHVVDNAGLVAEDRLFAPTFPRRDRLGRPVVTVLLEGHARITSAAGDRWLEPGDIALIEGKGAIRMRQQCAPRYRSVSIEWDRGWLGGALEGVETGRLDARALAAVRRIGGVVHHAGAASPEVAAAVAELLAVLAASGAPVEPVAQARLVEPVSARDVALSHALDASLSNLTGQPMLADLHEALGLGPRQLNRLVTAFNARFGFNASSWRDTRTRRRLMTGANLMTASGATTEAVARTVGYGSAAAFCHALALQQLPSPGALAERVAQLA